MQPHGRNSFFSTGATFARFLEDEFPPFGFFQFPPLGVKGNLSLLDSFIFARGLKQMEETVTLYERNA